MERCPLCRATFHGETHCRRCRADLSTLVNIEQQAAELAQRAVWLWAQGNANAAGEAAEASLALQNTRLARVIFILAQQRNSTAPRRSEPADIQPSSCCSGLS